jgi:hypothetical protein
LERQEKEHQLNVMSMDIEWDSQLKAQQVEFQANDSVYKIKLKEADSHLAVRIGFSF